MFAISWNNLRTKQLVLATGIFLIAVIVAASVASMLYLRGREIESWRRQLSDLSLVLAEQTYQTMSAAELAMESIAERIEATAPRDAADLRAKAGTAEMHQMLRDKISGLPAADVATVVAANGDVINFTRTYPAPQINLADRDYFLARRDQADMAAFVSIPVRNRGNGKWVFYLSRRLNDRQGHFLGLVLVGISVDQFTDFYERLGTNLGEGAAISLYRRDFSVLTRWPRQDESIGQRNLTGASHFVIEEMHKPADVIYTSLPRFSEGGRPTSRLTAVRLVERFPLIVTLVATEDLFLANWRHAVGTIGGVAAGAIAALLLAMAGLWRLSAQREQMAEWQRLLTRAVEQSNSSVVVTDPDANIIFVNAAFSRVTGYSPDEALGRNPRFLQSGQTPAESYRDLWQALASGRAWSGELHNRKKNGEAYWEVANIAPILDAQGRITHYIAVKDDITGRKQAEAQLREQKDFLSAILENEPECVKVIGRDGKLRQMNNAGLTMLEAESVDAVNAVGLEAFIAPDYRGPFVDLSRRVFRGEAGVLEFPVQGTRGTRRWLETHAAPLRDAEGNVTYLLAVTRDVTRRREAEQRLALSVRGADLAMTDWDIVHDRLVYGEGWSKLLGYAPEELPRDRAALIGLIRPEDVPVANGALVRHLKGETPFLEFEVRMRHRDGHWVWVLGRGMAVERTAAGRALRVAGTAMDVTGRKQAEAEIARLSQWNELLLNSAGEGIYGVDRDGLCSFINPAAVGMLGYERGEVLGRNPHYVFHHHHADDSPYPHDDCPVFVTLRDGIRRVAEEAFIRKDGAELPVLMTATPMHENGEIVGAEVVFQDIARRKAMEKELMRLATTDSLTGAANRRRFLEQLEMELARIKRFGKPAALLMADIDHFKNVNDTYGHAAGDAALRHFAELARQQLRRIDLFGRLGGEEFGILLPGTDGAGGLQFAERFRRHVADSPALSDKGPIPLTVSIGVAEFDPDDTAPDNILARADVALYRAKEGGRNRVEAT